MLIAHCLASVNTFWIDLVDIPSSMIPYTVPALPIWAITSWTSSVADVKFLLGDRSLFKNSGGPPSANNRLGPVMRTYIIWGFVSISSTKLSNVARSVAKTAFFVALANSLAVVTAFWVSCSLLEVRKKSRLLSTNITSSADSIRTIPSIVLKRKFNGVPIFLKVLSVLDHAQHCSHYPGPCQINWFWCPVDQALQKPAVNYGPFFC